MRAAAALQVDPNAREIGPKRRVGLFIGFVTLFIGLGYAVWVWEKLNRDPAIPLSDLAYTLLIGVVLYAVIVIPGLRWLGQVLIGKPLLRVDSRGLVWGRDWLHDVAVRWDEIAEIRAKKVSGHGVFTDRALMVVLRDRRAWQSRYRGFTRFELTLSRFVYDTPTAISTAELAISRDELLALIQRHFAGRIDLSGWR